MENKSNGVLKNGDKKVKIGILVIITMVLFFSLAIYFYTVDDGTYKNLISNKIKEIERTIL